MWPSLTEAFQFMRMHALPAGAKLDVFLNTFGLEKKKRVSGIDCQAMLSWAVPAPGRRPNGGMACT